LLAVYCSTLHRFQYTANYQKTGGESLGSGLNPSSACGVLPARPITNSFDYKDCSIIAWGVYPALVQELAVRFDSPEEATSGKSMWEVFRGWLVFKLLTYDFLVDHSLTVCRIGVFPTRVIK